MLRSSSDVARAQKLATEKPLTVDYLGLEWQFVSLAPKGAWYFRGQPGDEHPSFLFVSDEGRYRLEASHKPGWDELSRRVDDAAATATTTSLPGGSIHDWGVCLDRVTLNAWRTSLRAITLRARLEAHLDRSEDVTEAQYEEWFPVDYAAWKRASDAAIKARAKMSKVVAADVKRRGSLKHPVGSDRLRRVLVAVSR